MATKKHNAGASSEAEKFVDYQRRKYAREWEISSTHYEQQGSYERMADRMAASGLILEVGCGTGASTLELSRRGNTVIAVEENTACIRRARALLVRNGIQTDVLLRGAIVPLGAQRHKITYSPIRSVGKPTVLLVEGNILADRSLLEFLAECGPFDAVVCWLVGAHGAMGLNSSVDVSLVKSSSDYRLLVQNEVYVVADQLIRPGGVLHLVDRVMNVSQQILADTRASHEEQASITSLLVSEIDVIPYSEPGGSGAMQMVHVRADDTTAPVTGELAFVSVRCVKQSGP